MPDTGRVSHFSRRDFLRLSAGTAAAAYLAACTRSTGPTDASVLPTGPFLLSRRDPLYDRVCGLAPETTRRIVRGYYPGRSAELQVLPKAPNFIGDGLPHVGPWDYVSRVPMFWYGPGFIRSQGRVNTRVTSADIAPTWGKLLRYDFPAPNGQAIPDVFVPAAQRHEAPRVIVTLVWDGCGRNVLDTWPDEWPNLRSLVPQGTWIEQAEVGSSPTSSAQIHATIGTGAFPEIHGIVGHSIRIDGQIVGPWDKGPDYLLKPSFGDLFQEANAETVTGFVGTVPIQMGMLGHGAAWHDNPPPLAVMREAPDATTLGAEGSAWNLNAMLQQWYRFPEYANDFPPLSDYFDQLDRADGTHDGMWLGHTLADPIIEGGFQTPARIPYQTKLVEEVLSREGFGSDDHTDLFYLNYKLIDMVGHIFSMNSFEMRDCLRMQDEYLPVLIETLNHQVGEGRWAMVLTADHGSNPNPQVSGAFQISLNGLQAVIDENFAQGGAPVVEKVKQTEIFFNMGRLAEVGATLADVSDFVMTLTQADVLSEGVSIVSNPKAHVFEVAFPSDMIPTLPCEPVSRS